MAAGAISGATAVVGTADAFSAAFLCLADVTGGKTDDQTHDEDDQIIYRSHSFFL